MRNILALGLSVLETTESKPLSWRPAMSFRRELQYLMQTETTKDVKDHYELTKEELILLVGRDSSAWRARGGGCCRVPAIVRENGTGGRQSLHRERQ